MFMFREQKKKSQLTQTDQRDALLHAHKGGLGQWNKLATVVGRLLITSATNDGPC